MLHFLSISLFPLLLIIAAVSDVADMKIPNWLTGLTAAIFFPMALATGMPLNEFGWHLAGGVILFVAGFILFSIGLFGGGDAKLMAAAGLWFGTAETMQFLVLTVYVGGLLCLAFMLWSAIAYSLNQREPSSEKGKSWVRQMMKVNVPYGVALAAGAIMTFPATRWMDVA